MARQPLAVRPDDHTTLGRTPLYGWSPPRRDLYLKTDKRQTFMPLAGFESALLASEQLQIHALGCTATRYFRYKHQICDY